MSKTQTAPAGLAKEIVLQLGDLLGRIPKEHLLSGPHDPKQPVRFNVEELADVLGTGRGTMSLGRLAKACPGIIKPDADMRIDIPFPFQKVVGQIPHSDQACLRHRPTLSPRGESGTEAAIPPGRTPAPVIRPPNGNEDEKISLSLHAIVTALPKEWRTPGLEKLDESTRVTLPLHLVEHQLPTGRVEVPLAQLLAGMPSSLRGLFPSDPKRPAPIPLTEVFPNLPDRTTAGTPGVTRPGGHP